MSVEARLGPVNQKSVDSLPSLRERVVRHGKIRLVFICDENLGRSPMFAAAMRKRLQVVASDFPEIKSLVEVIRRFGWQT